MPDYNGAPKPHAIWETPRGTIELELYPGDAPMGVEYFVRLVESGAIVGTEFGRVVPNFVAQQRAVRDDVTLRDEVNRHGLTRGNLSWASAGLDTGDPATPSAARRSRTTKATSPRSAASSPVWMSSTASSSGTGSLPRG